MIRRPPRSTLFPTRRSSDLNLRASRPLSATFVNGRSVPPSPRERRRRSSARDRSEEHTSELQSRVDLVCRLLLEKKKKKKTNINTSMDDLCDYLSYTMYSVI